MASNRNAPRQVTLDVRATLQGNSSDGGAKPTAHAYAFSTGGKLLGQSALDSEGRASLGVQVAGVATGIRLIVGPSSGDKAPQLDELLRRGAQEQHLRVEPNAERLNAELYLSANQWINWFERCLVQGTLQKRVVRSGIAVDLPVCNATVEIFEVEPVWYILAKLPTELLAQLRQLILQPIPLPDPAPEQLANAAIFQTTRIAANLAGPSFNAAPSDVLRAQTALQQASGLDVLRSAAATASDLAFRQTLTENAIVIYPILCWLWPWRVTTTAVGTAATNECGHFSTFIFKSLFQPQQVNLYFRATQRLFGLFEVLIYAPTPIACNTWWNYQCGTPVTLTTEHPLAITCAPCPPVIAGENWVLFTAIGNLPLSRIFGTGQALGAPGPGQLGLVDNGAPWGGLLRPRLEFDNALRDTLGVEYYRISWKRDSEPATAYKPLNAAVARHYAHLIGTDLVLDAYALGPKTVGVQGNLFEIPPGVPPLGQWSIADAVTDTESGEFNTVTADGVELMDGLVQIRVELFDTAGNGVDIAAKGIRYFVPTSTDLSGTINTVDASTLGLVVGNTMVITLHVNNEACTASIAAPSIGGAVADPCCGVLHYGPGATATLAWTASQPHGFATYGFGVVRGVSGVYSASGDVGGGSFGTTISVDHLLNDNLLPGCTIGGCPVAGFSENLSVWAMAVDGWSRQSQYDASAVRAFVLAP